MSRGELPQSRLTPRQLPQGGSLWHGGKVFGRVKGPIPEDDFPRPGEGFSSTGNFAVLPETASSSPSPSVTARSPFCRVSDIFPRPGEGFSSTGNFAVLPETASSSPSPSVTARSPFCRVSDIFPRSGEVCQRERLWRNHPLCAFIRKFTAMPRALPLGELSRPIGID